MQKIYKNLTSLLIIIGFEYNGTTDYIYGEYILKTLVSHSTYYRLYKNDKIIIDKTIWNDLKPLEEFFKKELRAFKLNNILKHF